ncbi:hypothetical protein Q8A57_05445 [Porticoccus litoralis]|uniref:Uncharacterized protein n=1 Tax=Porticoccus litoralis TaxID=434086 RepID=A0AAW8B393_9GAMM|nr:hypothetical protein [Porticoccus litoralis]MDP1520411.1 hypothetical protein [Porticoccus litoralis]
MLDSKGCPWCEAKAHQPVAVGLREIVKTLHDSRVTCLKLVKLHIAHMFSGAQV